MSNVGKLETNQIELNNLFTLTTSLYESTVQRCPEWFLSSRVISH